MDYLAVRVLHARQAGGDGPAPPLTPENEISNHAPEVLAVVGSLYGIACLAVLLRAWVRIRMLKSFGLDDILITIAMLLSTACLVSIVSLTHYGLGRHVAIFAYHPQWIMPLFAWLYFYSIFVVLAYSFIKLSIGVFLLRLAQRTQYTRILQGILVFLVVFTIGSSLAIILQCQPIAAGYDLSLRPPTGTATCYAPSIFRNVGVFNSSINIATDLLFAILPIPMVWKLQLNIRTKLGLISILSLGFFAAATAIYKTPMQYHFFEEPDFTGHGVWYYVWQIVEMNVGILAACLPTLKPLFISFFETARAITNARTNRSRGSRSHNINPSGYFPHPQQQHAASSVSMEDLESPRKDLDPYQAHIMSVDERRQTFRLDGLGYVHWDSEGKSADSDEMPLKGRQGPMAGASTGREVLAQQCIVKTSEVRVH